MVEIRWRRNASTSCRLLICIALTVFAVECSAAESQSDSSHHRQKRLLWITNDARIALPPGTIMTITPTLALPFVRYPPYGFLSNMTVSLPFTIDFDKLGLTDNENPYGTLSSAFDATGGTWRRLGGTVAKTADFVADFLQRRLRKRDTDSATQAFEVPKNAFHGGERALLYGTAEDALENFGLNGKACLLRAICEVHGHALSNLGLVGEMLELFFTASKSPFADLLGEYIEAEKRGKFDGECWPYFKDCPKSLFRPTKNKYAKDAPREDPLVRDADNSKDPSSGLFPTDQPKRTASRVRLPRNAQRVSRSSFSQ